jgi:osmotically-inducible protein OsmY
MNIHKLLRDVTSLALFTVLSLGAGESRALMDPISLMGNAISTTLDVRTKSEVKADLEIAAGANKRLLDDKHAEWKGVTLLVFAQHVVIAGAVKSVDAKKLVENIVREDRRVRSVTNDLIVIRNKGDDGNFAEDTAIDTEVNAELTAAKGVNSVNMRWKSVNGNVILMGVAKSGKEASLAVSKIRGLKGVRSVKSRLRIVKKK